MRLKIFSKIFTISFKFRNRKKHVKNNPPKKVKLEKNKISPSTKPIKSESSKLPKTGGDPVLKIGIFSTIGEKLIWLSYFVASTGGVYYAGKTQWFRYTVNPTVISLERDFRSWNGTLPAMTLCYFSKVDPEKADAFIQRNWQINSSDEEYSYFFEFIEAVAGASIGNFESFLQFENDDRLENIDLKHLARTVYPEFKHVVTSFDKYAKVKNVEIFTERGLCNVINAPLPLLLDRGIRTATEIPNPLTCFFAKHQCFLKVDVYNSSTIQVHSPFEIPLFDAPDFHLDKADEIVAVYKVVETVVADSIRALSVNQRRCLFHNELMGMNGILSGNFCFMKCRVATALELCRCKPFFYPFLEGPECSVSGFNCLQKFSWPLWSLSVCACPKICNELKYFESFVNKRSWSVGNLPFMQKGSFRWELLTPKIRLKRDVIFSFEDVIVSFGGAATLFLGTSFMQLSENIYSIFWFIINTIVRICRGCKRIFSFKK